jgi:hypothetical protein
VVAAAAAGLPDFAEVGCPVVAGAACAPSAALDAVCSSVVGQYCRLSCHLAGADCCAGEALACKDDPAAAVAAGWSQLAAAGCASFVAACPASGTWPPAVDAGVLARYCPVTCGALPDLKPNSNHLLGVSRCGRSCDRVLCAASGHRG